MNTHDKIELPPLPPGYTSYEFPEGGYDADEMRAYARAAIEADRKRRQSEAEEVCAEAYQVVGSLLSDLGIFETEHAEKILDNLSQAKMVHKDVLPWPSFDRQRRGEPVAYGIKAVNTGEIATVLYGSDVDQVGEYRADLVVSLYTAPQPAEPDSAKCAECGAELIPVRPGKWQHPDCSQSPWASEPVAWPLASPEEADKGWTLDYRFLEQVERIASQRTNYTTSIEATEQVLIAANEVLRASQPAEPVKVPSDGDLLTCAGVSTHGDMPAIFGTADIRRFAECVLKHFAKNANEPVKVPRDDLAHEIWAAAQTAPGEGIEDAVDRIAALLARYGKGAP